MLKWVTLVEEVNESVWDSKVFAMLLLKEQQGDGCGLPLAPYMCVTQAIMSATLMPFSSQVTASRLRAYQTCCCMLTCEFNVPWVRAFNWPALVCVPAHTGSRPTRRRADNAGINTLRAIPWQFAWTQTRLILPSWLGIGEAMVDAASKVGHCSRTQAKKGFITHVTDQGIDYTYPYGICS